MAAAFDSVISARSIPAPARTGRGQLATQIEPQAEEYEIWIQEHGNWVLKAWSLDFDLGWALARVHRVPVRIVRTVCDGTTVIEKTVIAELQIPQTPTSNTQAPHTSDTV